MRTKDIIYTARFMKKTGPFQEPGGGEKKKKVNAQRGGGLGLERKIIMMNEKKEKMSVNVFGISSSAWDAASTKQADSN